MIAVAVASNVADVVVVVVELCRFGQDAVATDVELASRTPSAVAVAAAEVVVVAFPIPFAAAFDAFQIPFERVAIVVAAAPPFAFAAGPSAAARGVSALVAANIRLFHLFADVDCYYLEMGCRLLAHLVIRKGLKPFLDASDC